MKLITERHEVQRSPLGFALMLAGIAVATVGALVWLGALSWFGRLPGDIRVERPGFRLYLPLTTMVIVSVALTAAIALVRRFRG